MLNYEQHKKLFNLFSKDNNTVSSDNVKKMLLHLNYIVGNLNIKKKEINFKEFIEICEKHNTFDKNRLINSFKSFDIDNEGTIGVNKLLEILNHGDERFDEEEVEEIMRYLVSDLSGVVRYESFVDEI